MAHKNDKCLFKNIGLFLCTLIFISCGEETNFISYDSTNQTHKISFKMHSESFKQVSISRKLDLIWIVDNSGSMHNVQETLLKNYKNFIEIFLKNKIDVKMGITTTDTSGRGSIFEHNGEFLGTPPVLSSWLSDEEFEAAFLKNIMVGTKGSGRERGLEAMLFALEKNSDPSSNNYQFIRDDAFLAIIIVSDENDISPQSTKHYVDYFKNIKPNINKYAIYSIVDTKAKSYEDPYYEEVDLELYYSHRWENPGGLRYINAAINTGGGYYEITENFSDSLLDIGTNILSLINSFKLAHRPYEQSIVVKVDMQEIPKTSKSSNYGWFYDEKNQSIVFNEESIPKKDRIIKVEYNSLKLQESR